MKEIGVWDSVFGGSEKAGRGALFGRKKFAKIVSLKQNWVPLPAEQIFIFLFIFFALKRPHI